MSTSHLVLTAFLLLVITLLQAGSCKRDYSPEPNGSLTRSPTTQVSPSINKQERTAVPEGPWGGAGIRLQVTKHGAEIEYDCARGTISEPLSLDAEGRFQAMGSHSRDRPGPIRLGESSNAQAASFAGQVKGETMTLEVTLTAKSENIGSFTLTRGSEGRLRKCL